MKRRVGIVTCLIALVAVAGCGGGAGDSNPVSSTQASHATRPSDHVVQCRNRDRYGVHVAGYGDLGYRYPGKIQASIGPPYIAPGEMSDEGNMWWTSDCHSFTVVTAGSDGNNPVDGLLAINRTTQNEDRSHPHTSGTEIKVPNAGTLEITKAPLGPSVETWAQDRGEIEFISENGFTGTLHLSDDSVELDSKKSPLTKDSECNDVPAGHVGKLMAKNWLLKLGVVRAAEGIHPGLAVRNAGDLQAYCGSHPTARLDRATALILHSDPAP